MDQAPMGIGDWGLGIGPIPNPHKLLNNIIKIYPKICCLKEILA